MRDFSFQGISLHKDFPRRMTNRRWRGLAGWWAASDTRARRPKKLASPTGASRRNLSAWEVRRMCLLVVCFCKSATNPTHLRYVVWVRTWRCVQRACVFQGARPADQRWLGFLSRPERSNPRYVEHFWAKHSAFAPALRESRSWARSALGSRDLPQAWSEVHEP